MEESIHNATARLSLTGVKRQAGGKIWREREGACPNPNIGLKLVNPFSCYPCRLLSHPNPVLDSE